MIKKKNRNYIERYALALLLFEKEVWVKYSNIVAEKMFKSEARQMVLKFLRSHGGRLSYKMLSHEIRQRSSTIGSALAVQCKTAYIDLKKFKCDVDESEYIFKALVKYSATEETFQWMREYIELVEKGEIDKAEELKVRHFLYSSSIDAIGIDRGEIVRDFKERRQHIRDMVNNPDKYRLCKTGIKKLDKVIGGMAKGELILIAGHTSRGKSTLALNIAYRNQIMGRKILYFINEMPRLQIEFKYDSLVTKIPYRKFKFAKLSKKQIKIWRRKTLNLRKFGGEFNVISVASGCTSTLIKEIVKMHGDVDLVVVDSLLYMDSIKKSFSEQSGLGDITQELKGIGMQFGFPLVVLTQLNAESIEKEKLDYGDIGYSRKISHISDIIIGIPGPQDDDDATNMQLIKHRDGKKDFFFKVFIDWSINRVNNKPPLDTGDDQDYPQSFED